MRKLVQVGSHSARPPQVFGDEAESAGQVASGGRALMGHQGGLCPVLSVTVCQRPLRDPAPATHSILSSLPWLFALRTTLFLQV